jgi:glyoxylase-like metal-dependent hydrolase (beta-lactamase superfamily II)
VAAESVGRWSIGRVRVTRIVEIWPFVDPPGNLFLEGTPEAVRQHTWLLPDHATQSGEIVLAFQAFLITTPNRQILVDTCLGRDKTREHAVFANVQSSFLEDLERAGARADQVDTVLCTHLHHDHVGWNTRLVNGRWLPTFPNARYLFGEKEFSQQRDGHDSDSPHIRESVTPLIDAGCVDLVVGDHRVCAEVQLEPTPGHSPGHVSVHIESEGEHAVITGDLMHHPIQCAEPHWRTHFCSDHEQARTTRLNFLRKYEGRKVFVIGSHFGGKTGGWIIKDGAVWRMQW